MSKSNFTMSAGFYPGVYNFAFFRDSLPSKMLFVTHEEQSYSYNLRSRVSYLNEIVGELDDEQAVVCYFQNLCVILSFCYLTNPTHCNTALRPDY